MRDPFNGIYYWASKIICWVDLPFITRNIKSLERLFFFGRLKHTQYGDAVQDCIGR